MNPKAVLDFVAANNVKVVDIRFTDLPGLWHHISFPIHELGEKSFEDGFGMDGSSIRGWAAIHESDMLLIPDPSWYMLDPFTDVPTLVMIGDILDERGRETTRAIGGSDAAAIFHHLDVTSEEDWSAAISAAVARRGRARYPRQQCRHVSRQGHRGGEP